MPLWRVELLFFNHLIKDVFGLMLMNLQLMLINFDQPILICSVIIKLFHCVMEVRLRGSDF